MCIHPNDALYALDRAIQHSTAAGEMFPVIDDLRRIREIYQRAARETKPAHGLNLPATNTGD